MPQPPYKLAHAARNASRIVIEGVDEPAKNFASNVPKDYATSPDIEDRRKEMTTLLEPREYITKRLDDDIEHPARMSKQ